MINLNESPYRELLLALALPGVAGIAYFFKRWYEGTAFSSQLDKRAKLLAIRKDLTAEGLTIADLDKFEGELTKRRKNIHQIEDEVVAELADQRDGPRPGETQGELNILAGADLEISQALLAKALRELEMHCEDLPLVQSAQKAWEKYAKAEAKYRASYCEGGSMHPLIYCSELESLTVARIADVRARTEWLKSL